MPVSAKASAQGLLTSNIAANLPTTLLTACLPVSCNFTFHFAFGAGMSANILAKHCYARILTDCENSGLLPFWGKKSSTKGD
jgi:hypothetical protein